MSLGALTATTLRLPTADLGPASPLPAFTGLQRLPDLALSPKLAPDLRERMAYGRLASPLPYEIQNGYSRALTTRDIPAVRLANDRLEAYVLPGLGGRLWLLRDLGTGRDLVFANPRLQYANFALTDAWCAGGIEWNLGSTGHSATTSRPVFTGRISTDHGEVLRLWEWERTRDVVFSVDLMLAPESPVLLVFVRVRNVDPEPKPLYWWTNVAVPEQDGTRVLAPAERAWRTAYDGSIRSVAVPHPDSAEVDVSYPSTVAAAADYFFQIPADRRHWVAAVQPDGAGLAQTATGAMVGRKLFCWGTGAGGNRWPEWLSGPGERYLEIQSGLATTQLEHRRIEAGSTVTWAEAYVPLGLEPSAAHGTWPDAVASVERALEEVLGPTDLADWHHWWSGQVADRSPDEQLTAGSGAGLAELTVRGLDRQLLPDTPFDRPATDEFRHLVALARNEPVDLDAAGAELLVPPISARWSAAFARVTDGWWSRLMRAIRAHAAGNPDVAADLYRASMDAAGNPWAARGLALLAVDRGELDEAADRYRAAVRLAPEEVQLLVEATEFLLDVGRPRDCLELIEAAPAAARRPGRVRLQRCRALLADGSIEEARAILDGDLEVADLREGETLGTVWRAAHGDEPLPARHDFRMKPD